MTESSCGVILDVAGSRYASVHSTHAQLSSRAHILFETLSCCADRGRVQLFNEPSNFNNTVTPNNAVIAFCNALNRAQNFKTTHWLRFDTSK